MFIKFAELDQDFFDLEETSPVDVNYLVVMDLLNERSENGMELFDGSLEGRYDD